MGQPPHHPLIANPMTRFPKYAESRGSWGVAKVPTVVVEVEQDDGLIGVGVSTGGEAACFIIEQHLAMFVEGQSVKNISYIWEQMWRASIHYGGKGIGVHAISAVDIALWDLLGKVKNEPVYNLLGGRTMGRVPCCPYFRPPSSSSCCAVQCNAVLCCAVLCSAVQCCAVLCSAVRCCALLCVAVRCCAVQCGAVRPSALPSFLSDAFALDQGATMDILPGATVMTSLYQRCHHRPARSGAEDGLPWC